jgi:hypothetical protein
MTTTTDLFATNADLDAPVGGGSGTTDLTSALDSIAQEVTSTLPSAATTRPYATRAPNFLSACSTCASDTRDVSLVVRSDYALPDLTLDLLAAIVVESAAKGAKTEAA